MTESLKTGAGRLPCESAPKIAPEPAKAPVIPPYSDLCTGADAVFSLIFLLVAAAAAFVGLILRVVKNVFEQAVTLKDENDFTI